MKTLLTLTLGFLALSQSAEAASRGYPPFALKYPGETCTDAAIRTCRSMYLRPAWGKPDQGKATDCIVQAQPRCRAAGFKD